MPFNAITSFRIASNQRTTRQLANAVIDYAEAVLRGDVIDRCGSEILGDMKSLLAKFSIALLRCKQPLGPILCGRINTTDSDAAALFFSSVLKSMQFAAMEKWSEPQIRYSMRERRLAIRSLKYMSAPKPSEPETALTGKVTVY
ncbi:MAG: hypothetical protein JWQ23_4265 [Herminiimonas sp.]|nr:hypothetical protein [Herminiimonas sp.]